MQSMNPSAERSSANVLHGNGGVGCPALEVPTTEEDAAQKTVAEQLRREAEQLRSTLLQIQKEKAALEAQLQTQSSTGPAAAGKHEPPPPPILQEPSGPTMIQRMEAILGVDLDGDGIIGDPNAKAMSPATRAPTGAPASSAQASTSASTSAVPTVMATTTLDAFCALCNNGELLVEYMQSELERRIDESGGGAREARAAPAVAAPPATPELEPVLPPSLVASSEGAIRAGFVLITTPKSSLLRWAGAKSPHISSNLPRSHSSDGLPSPFRACVWPLLLQAPVHARTC